MIVVLTGAGISAESGVPTFRASDGLWEGHSVDRVATPEGYEADPELVLGFYDARRRALASVVPNAAHHALARLEDELGDDLLVVTQNVDDLHVRAGTLDLVRLHGSIFDLRCWDNCAAAPRSWRDDRVPFPEMPPRCPQCGGLARPGVVWFGESLDPVDIEAADALAACDVFIAAGTSAVVYPAAGFLLEASAHGAFTVELNTETTDATGSVDLAIHGPVEQTLAEVDALL